MRAILLPYAIILTTGRSQYDGRVVYCGQSTASEVILIFTTQLYSCVCSYNAIVFTS